MFSINGVSENKVLSNNDSVLSIREQEVFSEGGTLISSEGRFDVLNYYT